MIIRPYCLNGSIIRYQPGKRIFWGDLAQKYVRFAGDKADVDQVLVSSSESRGEFFNPGHKKKPLWPEQARGLKKVR
jgi:hypothetical protein